MVSTATTSINEAPDFLKDNPHIQNGYRYQMPIQSTLATMFSWHNETLNIWSQLIGFVLFFILFIRFAFNYKTGHKVPKWPLIVFQCGVMFCLIVSAIFHLLLSISKTYYDTWRKIDYCGIIVVMFTMFIPFVWYAFENKPKLKLIYILVAAIIAISCLITICLPALQTNAMHVLRPIVFMVLGVWGIVTIIHAYILYRGDPVIKKVVIFCFAQLISHLIGTLFYSTQWPESMRSSPITDYFSSHFIFHLFIILGLLFFHHAIILLVGARCSFTQRS